MKDFILFIVGLILTGCVGPGGQNSVLKHESQEPKLLTEEKFMERVSQSADQIYQGMQAISDAAQRYAADNKGHYPKGSFDQIKKLLVDNGYLETWPVIPDFAFTDPIQLEFRYSAGYDDMDGIGALDDAIYAQDLKIEICEEFVRKYGDPPNQEVLIHDYEVMRQRYPGEVLGRQMKIYAIRWSSYKNPDYCDIEWVIKYNK